MQRWLNNGQDIAKGAVWDIQYVEGKGFTLRNVGTGKYLKTNDTAKYDEPTYFTFCTLKDVTSEVNEKEIVVGSERNTTTYNLMGVPVGDDYRGIVIKNGKKFVVK